MCWRRKCRKARFPPLAPGKPFVWEAGWGQNLSSQEVTFPEAGKTMPHRGALTRRGNGCPHLTDRRPVEAAELGWPLWGACGQPLPQTPRHSPTGSGTPGARCHQSAPQAVWSMKNAGWSPTRCSTAGISHTGPPKAGMCILPWASPMPVTPTAPRDPCGKASWAGEAPMVTTRQASAPKKTQSSPAPHDGSGAGKATDRPIAALLEGSTHTPRMKSGITGRAPGQRLTGFWRLPTTAPNRSCRWGRREGAARRASCSPLERAPQPAEQSPGGAGSTSSVLVKNTAGRGRTSRHLPGTHQPRDEDAEPTPLLA